MNHHFTILILPFSRFQTISSLMAFKQILKNLPEAKLIFAYGSGMFPQLGQAKICQNMLDLVVVTDTPYIWHKHNLERNPTHYSFLKFFGPKAIATVQENYGASIYYNTMVEIEGRQVKYGVISEKSLVDDLLNWRTLYVSGRLHKPVHIIFKDAEHKVLQEAMEKNICNALHSALLLLPQTFSEQTLFRTLASLSYTGDFRMQIGEDKRKVENIVALNLEKFRELYEGAIGMFKSHLHWNMSQAILEQSYDQSSTLYHLTSLPSQLQHAINETALASIEDLAQNPTSCQKVVGIGLSKIVKASSWNQSLKGIFTAGLIKSLVYSQRKVKKYFNSL